MIVCGPLTIWFALVCKKCDISKTLVFFNQFSRGWTCLFWTMVQQFSRPCSTSALWSRAWRTQWEPGTTLHASAGTSTTVNRRWMMVIRCLNCLITVQISGSVQIRFFFCHGQALTGSTQTSAVLLTPLRWCATSLVGDRLAWNLSRCPRYVREAHVLLIIWWLHRCIIEKWLNCISHQKKKKCVFRWR